MMMIRAICLVVLFMLGISQLSIGQLPEDVSKLIARGKEFSQKGDTAKALEAYDEAIRLDPKSAIAFEHRGELWSQKKEFGKAIKDFDEAIRLEPKLVLAFIQRAITKQTKGDRFGAIKDYNEAIKLDAKNPQVYYQRGQCWYMQLDYTKAFKDFDEAIRLEPKNENSYWYRAHIYASKGEFDLAIKDYDESIRLNPKVYQFYSSRALLRAICPDKAYRDGAMAIADAKQACELTQWKNTNELKVLATAYGSTEDYTEAIKYLEKWQEIALADPSYPTISLMLGQLQLKQYEEKKAKQKKKD